MTMIKIETGDTVFNRVTRETWQVAFVRNGMLWWCGWPEGCTDVTSCLLVDKATPDERKQLINDMANMHSPHDARQRYAQQITRTSPSQ